MEKLVEHFIGIDITNPDELCYCLVRHINGKPDDIVMIKRMNNKEQFESEVKQLSKIFEVKIISE